MQYIVYKITNLINKKIYIGVHKTKNINDDYMGSGKILKFAIKKYGIENFEKEILKVFNNSEDMFNMESKIVNEDFVKDQNNYNLKIGGEGGWDHINSNRTLEHNKNISKAKKGTKNKFKGIPLNLETVSKIKKSKIEFFKNGGISGFADKKHSEETKRKIGEANSKHQSGTGNSQFGTMWIHNLEEKVSKKIKKEELPTWEQEGWFKGRKIKF